ncbi:MAG: CDP-alcohol phosphatidyltransferase family protein [Methanomethylovorans sp.]|uniref:CDP-alcohol phosphatidyltransferase family protein n=1 Tax=Methanomethylovorans sp. TaxID=2758717 RepID=UPI001BD4CADF|nr:CDP-alcohol phosphatidyltransferase family protein [Methanomethylovorans sp.]
MTSDSLRPHVTRFISPLAYKAADAGITPNQISFLSLVFAILAGVFYYHSFSEPLLVLAGAFMVFLNSLFDAIDGLMARYLKTVGPKGDFIDHVIDRYADVIIICSIFFAGHVQWQIGVIAIVGVLITSYLGTQAQALHLGRYYGGIMGRADRLLLVMTASVVYVVYPYHIFLFNLLGWVMVIIAVASHITAFQRIWHIWQHL